MVNLFQYFMTDNIKIVVRVRPFNQNEANQSCVIQMDDDQVKITNPQTKQPKEFAFHRCYWSVDDSMGKPPIDNKFLFEDIGKEILQHTYNGYNSTIFAYGQTGSGKSYSIQGYPPEKGLLQMCCEDIFKNRIQQNKTNGISSTVNVSYLEIYNQKLRDLLNPTDTELKIMSNANNMMMIQGLSSTLCESYADVQKLFSDGKKIRVIGAHAMNKNSSRSHAVFTINYKQVGKGKILQSKFNIVDLAGSERQSKTHATGQRLQQANNINKSLTNLGIVIEALANNCIKKQKNHVPYRNSQLTHLLSESLGGNSKTFMIAAISPASSNYEQSLSTLRFAQRVASIQTVSKKNVEQKGNFNKDLLNQIDRLKAQLAKVQIINTNTHSHSHSVEYIKVEDNTKIKQLQQQLRAMMEQLSNNKDLLDDMEKRLEQQRLKKMAQEQNRNKALREAGLSTDGGYGQEKVQEDKNTPYLMNISDDPTLAGMLVYHLKQGETKVGTSEHEENDIKINSLGMHKKHCTFTRNGKDIFIQPGIQDCKVMVNGLIVKQKKKLKHIDRIMLGAANSFKLIIPGEKVEVNQSLIRFGEFLDDKLAAETDQSKNIKAFLQQLQERLDRDIFARFKQKFKNGLQSIDQANQITQMRYKKYPLKQRNLQFKLNIILDVNNYLYSQPTLIIECRHKETKEVQFLWSDEKFQDRLDGMVEWYSDVDSKKQSNEASYYQFDPWFEVTDAFMKERENVDRMSPKQQLMHWIEKIKGVSKKYQNLIAEQKELMSYFKQSGIKNQDQLEEYADFFFREFQIDPSRQKSLKALRQNQQLHKRIRRFMQCCAQIQQCNIDNKQLHKRKHKYEVILTNPNTQNQNQIGVVQPSPNKPAGNPQMQAHYLQKIQELKEQITKKIKIIKEYQSRYQ